MLKFSILKSTTLSSIGGGIGSYGSLGGGIGGIGHGGS